MHASIKIQATLEESCSLGVCWIGFCEIAKLIRSVGCRSGTICELAGRWESPSEGRSLRNCQPS